MSDIDDGGPAFPCPETEKYHPQFGMSLRDWFAGMALPACTHVCTPLECETGESMHGMIARRSYELADAMIAARKVTP